MITQVFVPGRGPNSRPLRVIARDIMLDWCPVYFGAVPYLKAMATMGSIEENYGHDPGYSVVAYFLANAATWRGPTARAIKKELNAMLRS